MPLSLVKIVLEVTQVLVGGCLEFAVALLESHVEIPFVMFVLVDETSIVVVLALAQSAHIETLGLLAEFPLVVVEEAYFLALELLGLSLPEGEFLVHPPVADKVSILESEQVLVITDQQ